MRYNVYVYIYTHEKKKRQYRGICVISLKSIMFQEGSNRSTKMDMKRKVIFKGIFCINSLEWNSSCNSSNIHKSISDEHFSKYENVKCTKEIKGKKKWFE